MSTELEYLQKHAENCETLGYFTDRDKCTQAADRLEALESENSELRNRLKTTEQYELAHAKEAGELRKDNERLDWLQSQLAHPHYWRDLIMRWDNEDGYWLSTLERGCLPDENNMEWSGKQSTVREAIDAAMKEGKV